MTTTSDPRASEAHRIEVDRGAAIELRLFAPATGTATGAVLIGGAMGVRQAFYRPFAQWLADHSSGAAAISLTAPGEIILTAEFKISLLRAIVAKKLHCRAEVVRPGSQLCFVEASVEAETADGERKLVARASVTLAVLGADHHAARSAAGRR